MASKPKPDRVSKEALPKPPGSEPHDQPVRDVRQDPAPNPNQPIEKKRPERRP